MKADRDDRTQRPKRERQSGGEWLAAIAIGATVTVLAFDLAQNKPLFFSNPSIAQTPLEGTYTPKCKLSESVHLPLIPRSSRPGMTCTNTTVNKPHKSIPFATMPTKLLEKTINKHCNHRTRTG